MTPRCLFVGLLFQTCHVGKFELGGQGIQIDRTYRVGFPHIGVPIGDPNMGLVWYSTVQCPNLR